MRRHWVALTIGLIAGCYRPPPVTVEPVRLWVAPGLPGEVAAELARGFKIADPKLVATIDEAEVAWLRDPTEAIDLARRVRLSSAPEQPRVPDAFQDPARRFAPVGAIAHVLVLPDRPAAGWSPDELRELADPRVRGRVAMTALGRGDGPLVVAALELAYGERGATGWLEQLARNEPVLVGTDAEAVARVADGSAAVALVDSLTAGAARGRPGLRIVFPDQKAKGCVTIPTALVLLNGASPAARKFSAWLASPDAEEVLAQRVPGLLPLREGATAPDGIVPVWKMTALTVKWDALAQREPWWEQWLATWPARDRR